MKEMVHSFLFALGSFLGGLGVGSIPSDEAHSAPSDEKHKGEIDRDAAEVIAMLGIEGHFCVSFQGLADGIRYPIMGLLQYFATLIDEARTSCVGRAGHTASVFDGTKLRKLEVLTISRREPPPAVIGD